MAATDLFEQEAGALALAVAVLSAREASAEEYHAVLAELARNYERMMREMRRLINRSDRKEMELNLLNARLKQISEELDYKASHDTLTGTLNRGAVFDRAAYHLTRSPLSLIVLDIDYFKRINDEFGHPKGDAVIQELIQRIKQALGGVGEVGRVGGEEFSILLPEIALDDATQLAEQVRHAIACDFFKCLPGRYVTASFGVSWSPSGSEFEAAYARADAVLYRAKHGGRNRVETDNSVMECVPACL